MAAACMTHHSAVRCVGVLRGRLTNTDVREKRRERGDQVTLVLLRREPAIDAIVGGADAAGADRSIRLPVKEPGRGGNIYIQGACAKRRNCKLESANAAQPDDECYSLPSRACVCVCARHMPVSADPKESLLQNKRTQISGAFNDRVAGSKTVKDLKDV